MRYGLLAAGVALFLGCAMCAVAGTASAGGPGAMLAPLDDNASPMSFKLPSNVAPGANAQVGANGVSPNDVHLGLPASVAVPEPSTIALFAAGAALLCGVLRVRGRSK